MKKIFALLLLCCAAVTTMAQAPLQFALRHDVPVAGVPQPWSGGLSAPQFSTIDLNRDGRPDLFAYDRMQRKVFTWLAAQQNGSWNYRYAPEYEALFPDDLQAWVLLRNYNCDGLKDIFTSTPQGIKVYRQVVTSNQKLTFELAEEVLLYGNGINLQLLSADIPAIVDVDGDGDLDILVAEFAHGQRLEYYQNMQKEEGLSCNTLKFVRNTNWWGTITECDGCNNYTFGAECRVAAPMHSGHMGSTLLLLDMDADGDKELLTGAVNCHDLVLMENEGTKFEALMTDLTVGFPANTRPANGFKFPAAYYEDVTFDGIPDLLVATNLADAHERPDLQRAVWLYKNKGTADKPVFEFVQDDFLQDQMLDFGEGAYPAFADVDGDGLLDMLVGNKAAYRNTNYTATISHYRNTGTAAAPAFTLVTDDYLNLESRQLLTIKPIFADINGDGKTDLVLTYTDKQTNATRIVYLPSTAAQNQPANYSFDEQVLLLAATTGDAPAFFDADKDGDLDMVLGQATGELQLYTNTGNRSNPAYSLTTSNLGGIGFSFDARNLHPATIDIDGDGTTDLLTTDDTGTIKVYRNLAAILNQSFLAETELLENPFTDALQQTRFGTGLSVTAAPLGGAGKLYLTVGTQGGGLYLLQQTSGYKNGTSADALTIVVYPNPVNKTANPAVNAEASEPVIVTVYDAVGRRVHENGAGYRQVNSLPVRNFKAGMYFLKATNRQGKSKTIKFVVQ